MPMDFDHVRERVQARGFVLRGGFHPVPGDAVPQLSDGRAAKTVVLLGGVGSSFWPAFRASPEAEHEHEALDRWTRRVAGELAEELGAMPLFPFGGPPYLPFQRWAKRAEPVHDSPLGLLIHPEFGLWHAYRAALAFADRLDLPVRPEAESPCASCVDKPCLTACPVSAFTGKSYDVPRCIAHIGRPEGGACIENACLARRACPVGRAYAYEPEQARFHMSAFLRALRTQGRGPVPESA
jgi:hypothetical protein